MTTQNVQTVQSKADLALVILAGAVALAGVLAFTFLSEQATLVRVGVLLAGLVAGVAIAWTTQSGKRFIAYGREAYEELRRVVWPTKKETFSTTGVVFAFVVIMSVFLFLVDKSVEWLLYDVFLKLG
ncbi:MAG: preprotein translocase subunit SecE [Burkholderiaceae bacterium]